MYPRKVLIVGGSGFVGSAVASRLAAAGVALVVPTRRRERARHLLPLPTIEVVEADVFDPPTLARLMAGVDAVVSLVGVLHSPSGQPYGPAFARAHVELPTRLVAAAREAGFSASDAGLLLGVITGISIPLSFLVLSASQLPAWGWLLPLGLLLLIYPLNAWRDAPVFPTPFNALKGLAEVVQLPGQALVLDAGCGMGREATLYLLERGVRLTGTDAWSWDAPFVYTKKINKGLLFALINSFRSLIGS